MTDDSHGDATGRVTAPMQEYTGSDVIVGFVVLLIGLFVVAALPYLF
ncbi:MAG: hypothetical protein ABEJ44_01985 [Halanaeroarchaeum sp.]